jgi:hypothetical protein
MQRMADDAEGREYEWAEEKLHRILVCQFFFRVVLDSAGPLPGIKSGKKYRLVTLDSSSKWV